MAANTRNLIPLILSSLLIVLICILSIFRMKNQNIWADTVINYDLVIAAVYIFWMILESIVSKKEISKGDNRKDFGTCELYAMGQAGVLLSALWLDSAWAAPIFWHGVGLSIFICGILFRLWAILTLGRYYSHMVRKMEGHQIITKGPYQFVRHPAYTGMILANAGIVIFFFNVISLAIFLFILIPAIALRILIEEKTLFQIHGYPEYAKLKKRIVPAIW